MRRFLWILFFALDALLVVLFLAGYLAYYIRPESFWWFELIAVFMPYLSGLLVLATIPLIIGRRWIALGVHFVLLVLAVVRLDPQRLFHEKEERDGDLTIMTFNVPRWWGYHMPEKTAEMAQLVERIDPDIIGLQEAHIAYYPEEPPLRAAPYVAVIFDSLGFRTVGPEAEGATYTPQPILSRTELVGQTQTMLRQDPADSVYTAVTRTQLRWDGREFAVYNLHLRTFGEKKPWNDEKAPNFKAADLIPYFRRYRDAYRVRAWEVDQIMEMLEDETMPVIVLGDLNSTPHNWVMRRLTGRLRDTFDEAGEGWGMTYHTRLPIFRIDYVLVSEEFEVVSADVIDAYLSDHLPLVVKLRWRE